MEGGKRLKGLSVREDSAVQSGMRVFWHQGGLFIEPEGDQERQALTALVSNVTFGKPQGRVILSGSSELGSDQLFESLVGDHQPVPCSLTSESQHKKHVVSINTKLG